MAALTDEPMMPIEKSALVHSARVIWTVMANLEHPDGDRPLAHMLPDRLESPIEELMAELLIKILDPACTLVAQHKVRTSFGDYRLDFLLIGQGGSPRVAIECDGAKHHRGFRDAWRDAAILGGGHVDGIIRVRGRDLHRHRDDISYAMCSRVPELFSARGRQNAAHLASPEIVEGIRRLRGHVSAWYSTPPDENGEVAEGWSDFLSMTTSGVLANFCTEWMERHACLQSDPRLGVDGWAAWEESEFAKAMADSDRR